MSATVTRPMSATRGLTRVWTSVIGPVETITGPAEVTTPAPVIGQLTATISSERQNSQQRQRHGEVEKHPGRRNAIRGEETNQEQRDTKRDGEQCKVLMRDQQCVRRRGSCRVIR